MSIILSHSTARAVWRLIMAPPQPEEPPLPVAKIANSKPTPADVDQARRYLERHDLPADIIHCITFSPKQGYARKKTGALLHHCLLVPKRKNLVELEPGLFIVNVELCAFQAGGEMELPELVEYFYELCGAYSLEHENDTHYIERPALTDRKQLAKQFSAARGMAGIALAQRALGMTREGCRSPLETAFALTIVLPKSEGGLGIRGFDTDYLIRVPANAAALTRRTHFYFDGYLESSRTDLEYNGFTHDSNESLSIDEERRLALASMGIAVITVNRHSFFDKQSFVRIMTAIIRREKIRPSRFPNGFPQLQERLRLFVLRRYIEEQLRSEAESKMQQEILSPGELLDPLEELEINYVQEYDAPEPYDNLEPEGKVFGLAKKTANTAKT